MMHDRFQHTQSLVTNSNNNSYNDICRSGDRNHIASCRGNATKAWILAVFAMSFPRELLCRLPSHIFYTYAAVDSIFGWFRLRKLKLETMSILFDSFQKKELCDCKQQHNDTAACVARTVSVTSAIQWLLTCTLPSNLHCSWAILKYYIFYMSKEWIRRNFMSSRNWLFIQHDSHFARF